MNSGSYNFLIGLEQQPLDSFPCPQFWPLQLSHQHPFIEHLLHGSNESPQPFIHRVYVLMEFMGEPECKQLYNGTVVTWSRKRNKGTERERIDHSRQPLWSYFGQRPEWSQGAMQLCIWENTPGRMKSKRKEKQGGPQGLTSSYSSGFYRHRIVSLQGGEEQLTIMGQNEAPDLTRVISGLFPCIPFQASMLHWGGCCCENGLNSTTTHMLPRILTTAFARLHWEGISLLSINISSGMVLKCNVRHFYNSTSRVKW